MDKQKQQVEAQIADAVRQRLGEKGPSVAPAETGKLGAKTWSVRAIVDWEPREGWTASVRVTVAKRWPWTGYDVTAIAGNDGGAFYRVEELVDAVIAQLRPG